MVGVNVNPDVKVIGRDSPEYRAELLKVTQEFEGVLLAKMFQAMRATVPESDLFGGEYERGVYEDLLYTELSGLSARAEGIGIAEMLYQSFLGEDAPPPGDDKQTGEVDHV